MDWEKRYQENDIPWDIGMAHPLWKEYLHSESIRGAVGVPACGRGHDVHEAALAGYEAWGWDISKSAIEWAELHYPHKRTHFEKRDLFRLYPDWEGKFTVIWEWNCFCIFPPEERKHYLRMLLHLLEPNGLLLGVFRIANEKKKGDAEEDEQGPPWWIGETELDQFLSPFFSLSSARTVEETEQGTLSLRKYRCSI